MLENVRFLPEDEANDPAFAQQLASLGEIFCNDAFASSHRVHASVVGVAQYLPAYAGRLMEAELNALHAALDYPKKPLIAVIGGAKVSTKIGLLNNLAQTVDSLIIGGAMANTFLKRKATTRATASSTTPRSRRPTRSGRRWASDSCCRSTSWPRSRPCPGSRCACFRPPTLRPAGSPWTSGPRASTCLPSTCRAPAASSGKERWASPKCRSSAPAQKLNARPSPR